MNFKTNILCFLLLSLVSISCKQGAGSMAPLSAFGTGGGLASETIPSSSKVNQWIDDQVVSSPKSCPIYSDGETDYSDLPKIADSSRPWDPSWSKTALDTLNEPKFKRMLDMEINKDDLEKLNCPNFNEMEEKDKKKFYILLISSMAHAESGFKEKTYFQEPKQKSAIDDSYGLLQIDPNNGRNSYGCETKSFKKSGKVVLGRENDGGMFDPHLNIKCGLRILKGQILSKYSSRRGRLFTSNTYWAALRPGNNACNKTQNRFKSQVSQISACTKDSDSSSLPDGGTIGELRNFNLTEQCEKVSDISRKYKPIIENDLYDPFTIPKKKHFFEL
ncbi:hypothetical protein [Halobacteriovorax sp. HLS]|uniref:hypothetical protein n=1 Tax=Halobacteriovorax sp. HLS TaxID=2234000 RepID=UPI000FDC9FC7|nr:hypothetical protein [Halobacteriovorax sp. HLS]